MNIVPCFRSSNLLLATSVVLCSISVAQVAQLWSTSMRLPFIQAASWQTSKQLRSELQAERSTLVGHSWGAMLALLYGTTYPEQVERLLLIGLGPLSDEMDRVARANLMKPRLRSLHALRKDFADSRFSSRSRQRNVQYDLKDWQEKLTRRQALLSVVEAEGLEVAEAPGAQLYDLCQPHFEVYSQKVQIGQLYGLLVCYEGEVVEEREAQDVRNFWGGGRAKPGQKGGQGLPPGHSGKRHLPDTSLLRPAHW
ncbi:MAG TPA: alpha/beta hydrolase [Anaerolineae bacterium]|nr:alpha/beta hydrolase [Anaerolineae bacterium]